LSISRNRFNVAFLDNKRVHRQNLNLDGRRLPHKFRNTIYKYSKKVIDHYFSTAEEKLYKK